MHESATFTRSGHDYMDLSSRFKLKQTDFRRQFAHTYVYRLWSLAPSVEKNARATWGDDVIVRKLDQLQPGEECVIIGTIFKNMKLKPNVLLEIGKSYRILAPPPKPRYTDDSDEVILEDESQRILLIGNINVKKTITGCVAAAFGSINEYDMGKFLVRAIAYRAFPDQVPRPILSTDKYLVIVSGLEVGGEAVSMIHLQLLVDLLTGQIGLEDTQEWIAQIVRVVLAGNSLCDSPVIGVDRKTPSKHPSKKSKVVLKDGISALDDILAQLAAGVDVDIMPGASDPTNFILPQQPLHPCLFPKATRYETFHCVTNPYNFSLDGIEVLGSSGQPVQDFCRFSEFEDQLDALEHTLVVGHMAPTAPDTVGSYPYTDSDPFIIDSFPHIYFNGNAPCLSKKVFRGGRNETTLLVNIPCFSRSFTCAAINLRTLDVRPIKVAVSDVSGDQQS